MFLQYFSDAVGSQLLSREGSAFSAQSQMRPAAVRPITVTQVKETTCSRLHFTSLADTCGNAESIQPTAADTRRATTAAPHLADAAIRAATAAAHPDRVQRKCVDDSILILTLSSPVQGAAVPPMARMPQPQQQAHRY